MLNGISPSPQVEYKFMSQKENPANGNDLCNYVFGGYERGLERHKEFKRFLACVSSTPTPSRKEAPNWKIEPLCRQIIFISQEAICLGKWISIDEQTIGFKGNFNV